MKLCSAHFTSNSSWTAPAGVTRVMLIGQGGGQGGDGGGNTDYDPGFGGVGTSPYLLHVNVVPNTTYTINIGSGGTGGTPRTSFGSNGGTGGDTTFGALATFAGGRTLSRFSSIPQTGFVNRSFISYYPGLIYTMSSGFAKTDTSSSGVDDGSYYGGAAGSPGWVGSAGGQGGNANSSGTGYNGSSAVGIGAGGGGGGAGLTGGSGGNGGPGQLWVIWVE